MSLGVAVAGSGVCGRASGGGVIMRVITRGSGSGFMISAILETGLCNGEVSESEDGCVEGVTGDAGNGGSGGTFGSG